MLARCVGLALLTFVCKRLKRSGQDIGRALVAVEATTPMPRHPRDACMKMSS
jgi:hypothetical protein